MKTNLKNYQRAQTLCAKYKNLETIEKYSNKEVFEICKKIRERVENKIPAISVNDFCKSLIKKRLEKIAMALPSTGYNMGDYKKVTFNKIEGEYNFISTYAGRYRGSETYGRVSFILTLEQLRHTYVVGGLITFIPPQKNRVKKCYWYAGEGKKQRFELIKVEGYIFNGFHALTKIEAKRGGQKLLDIEREERRRAVEFKQKYAKALRMQYVYNDSLAAGNCKIGTDAFILRCRIDKNKKYRGSYLISLAEQRSKNVMSYVLRMIRHKARQM
jgi:hypothetical protein